MLVFNCSVLYFQFQFQFQFQFTMSQFCVNSVISKTLLEYIQPPDWTVLIAELECHDFVQVQWKRMKNPYTTETDPKFSKICKILFINTNSVILQEVEISPNSNRFVTYKINFDDWEDIFLGWGDSRKAVYQQLWDDGFLLYL